MNFYEGMFIIDSSLGEEGIEKTIKEIEDFITSKKGGVKEVEKIGKRKLGYKIGKSEEGFYWLAYFSLNPKEIVNFKRKCKLNQAVVRSLILESDPNSMTKFSELNKE